MVPPDVPLDVFPIGLRMCPFLTTLAIMPTVVYSLNIGINYLYHLSPLGLAPFSARLHRWRCLATLQLLGFPLRNPAILGFSVRLMGF